MRNKSVTEAQLLYEYTNEQIHVLAARNGSDELDRALIRRSVISDLLIRYCGYSDIDVELVLAGINQNLNRQAMRLNGGEPNGRT